MSDISRSWYISRCFVFLIQLCNNITDTIAHPTLIPAQNQLIQIGIKLVNIDLLS